MAELSDAALLNGRHIARFEAKPYPQPLPATAVARGFEAVAFPKLVRELRHDDACIRRKAVLAARELLAAPQSLVQCIAAGATPALVALLQEPEEMLRRDAAAALQLLLRRELGARDLLQHGGLAPLLGLVGAASAAGVRDEAYDALLELARFEVGRAALSAHKGALPALVARAQHEDPPRAARALGVLRAVAQVRASESTLGQLIYNAGAVPVLAGLLDAAAQPPAVRAAAARVLAALCSTRPEAITQAVGAGCVPRLVAGLVVAGADSRDEAAMELADASAAAVANISAAKAGKVAFTEAGGVAALSALVSAVLERSGPGAPGGGSDGMGHGSGGDSGSLPCLLLNIAASAAELPEARRQLLAGGGAAVVKALAARATQGQRPADGEGSPLLPGGDAAAAAAASGSAGAALRALGFTHWPQ
ncbi:MAG: armadillo-type protein [Monoraphidium minutum]|nr:MAG: armadillo-type protein [Monoraphidium minutum]